MPKNLLILLSTFFCLFNHIILAQRHADSLILAKIRTAAEAKHLQSIINNFADLNGPRLLGTKHYFESAQWAKQQLTSFGADKSYFESFDQQYRGWNVQSFNVEMTSPSYMHIIAYPLAYTRSTSGLVSGEAVLLQHVDSLAKLKGKLRNKVLLLAQDFHSFGASQQILSERLSKEILKQAAKILTRMTC